MPSPEPPTSRRRPGRELVVTLLSVLLGLQPVTTDLYLPALPAIAHAFGGAVASAQLTLSALILAFGVGQLVMGPASDRYGRKPVLLWGLSLHLVGSVAGTWAPDIGLLVFARVLQGLGLAASVVCARAMVRDLYEPLEGTRIMSWGLTGLGAIAVLSPSVGGFVAGQASWRATIAATGAVSALGLTLVAWGMPETLAQRNLHALVPARMLDTWLRIGRHPTFLAWALLVTCTYGGLYTYLASSSFVYINVLGTSRATYGMFLTGASLSYLLGTVLCRALLSRVGLLATVRVGGVLSLCGGLAAGALSLAGALTPWTLCLSMAAFSLGHGIHQPCGSAGLARPFPQQAGAASALGGFMSAAVAFVIGQWLGVTLNLTAYPLSLTLCFFAVVTCLVAYTLVQRHGDASLTEGSVSDPSPVRGLAP